MKAICEFWCSPLRQETYSEKFIVPSTFEHDVVSEIRENYADSFGDFWYDVFGENYNTVGGLWKVVCIVEVNYNHFYDWEGCPDCETIFEVEVMFKDKCQSLTELKWQWLELTGRDEAYNEKQMEKWHETNL